MNARHRPPPTSSPFSCAMLDAADAAPRENPQLAVSNTAAVADGTCVRFTLKSAGKEWTAAITAKALVEHFGARADNAALLACYQEHSGAIHRVAASKDVSTLDGGVLITGSDFHAQDGSTPLPGLKE